MGSGGSGSSFGTKNQWDAAEYYVSGEGMWINQYFRKNGEGFGDLSDFEKGFVKDLDALTTGSRPRENTLYRSVDASAIFGEGPAADVWALEAVLNGQKVSPDIQATANQLLKSAIGREITDKGYMSTTKDYSIASGFGSFTGSGAPVVLELTGAQKVKGADVSRLDKNVSAGYAQKEVLLSRGQRYTPKRIYMKNGSLVVQAELKSQRTH